MKHARRGYSLIEILVVITLASVTLTQATLAMHGLMRTERRVGDESQRERIIERLATQLRSDAHGAMEGALAGGESTVVSKEMVLQLQEGRSIAYSVADRHIERVVRRNEEVEHRDRFRIAMPDSYWSIDPEREHPLLTLHLRDDADGRLMRGEWTIHAAIGLSVPQTRSE